MLARTVFGGASMRALRALLCLAAADACTQILVPSPTGEVVVANTVESGDYVAVHGGHFVHMTHRSDVLGGGSGTSCGADCRHRLDAADDRGACATFPAKYGFVGQMNEQGLFVSHHMLKLSVYEARDAADGAPLGVCARDVDQWLLGTFGSVAELRTELDRPGRLRVVADPPGAPGGPITYTWGVVDASGSAAVLEWVKGALRVHNNTRVGVLTNDPTWEWHVANLNNYAALQRGWYKANTDGIEVAVDDAWYPWADNAYYDPRPPDGGPVGVPAPIGHGFNLLGLPGDGGGASRFVKSFFQRAYALAQAPPADLEGALVLAQELLNTVYKVKGTIASADAADALETTPVAMLAVPRLRTVYHRGRADLTWRKIDLSRLSFQQQPSERKRVRVASAQFHSIDVTSWLEHSAEYSAAEVVE